MKIYVVGSLNMDLVIRAPYMPENGVTISGDDVAYYRMNSQGEISHLILKDVTGDMHRGQSLVVWAIREGREVAREVDESLERYTNMNLQ